MHIFDKYSWNDTYHGVTKDTEYNLNEIFFFQMSFFGASYVVLTGNKATLLNSHFKLHIIWGKKKELYDTKFV